MNLLKSFVIKNLKLNKKRTFVTILGIILSIALLTAVSSMYSSALQALINYEIYVMGDFHVLFKDVKKEDIDALKVNRKISDVFLTTNIGYAKLDESSNNFKPYAYVKGFTKESLTNLSVRLKAGRLPENDNEILIPTHLKSNGRVEYNIGDTITLNIGKRVFEDQELTQDDPVIYNEEGTIIQDKIIDTTAKTYKIVGIIERPATNIEGFTAPGYTFVTLVNESDITKAHVYAKFNKYGLKNYYDTIAMVEGIEPNLFNKYVNSECNSIEECDKLNKEISNHIKYDLDVNDYLIMLETKPLSDGTMSGLGVIAIIICIIIVVTSILCIKNSFDISIVEKTKQFGMLKSIGATKKQIRHTVLFEALILGLIGLPLGILLGLTASFILCKVCNILMNEAVVSELNIPFVINFYAIMFSIILGSLTIYLSAIRSAFKASKVSPIDLIRNSASIKIKKIRQNKLVLKIFGIGGDISYKNIKRNKNKYRTTVLSLIISITIFIALTYFINLFYTAIKVDFGGSDENISYSYVIEDDVARNKVKASVEHELVKDYAITRIDGLRLKNAKSVKDKDNQSSIDVFNSEATVISLDDHQFNKYTKSLGLDSSKMDNKIIVIDQIALPNKNKKKLVHSLANQEGDTLVFKYLGDDEENTFKYEIAKITFETPFSVTLGNNSNLIVIMNEFTFNTFAFEEDYYYVKIDASNPDKLQDVLEKEIFVGEDNLGVSNNAENVRIVKNLLLLTAIFLYGFIIVVSLIGLTNIFNTLTTTMELRKQEFAMLKSIGMTSHEFRKMILCESFFICFRAIIISLVLGSGLSYLIYYVLGKDMGIIFQLPYIPIIVAIVGVVILIYVIMRYSINRINKQNTIETIRNENI